MADWLVEPIVEKLINACSQYLKDQVRWQTGMKDELQRLQDNLPKIQAVIIFASSQAEIRDQNPALNKWLWQLRNAIDEADDVIDEFEYLKLEEQATKNKKKRKVRFIMKSINRRLAKFCKRLLECDPNLKRLVEAVKKLDKVSAGVETFFFLVKEAKQEQKEQKLQLYRERETGAFPKNDQIGRWKEKNFVIQWLRDPSNEYQTQTTSSRYGKISLLSIVGHGGMGKTTLLQHVYKEITEEFDLKIWVCVSIDFDVKKVIADMLESLTDHRPRLETLVALQERLERKVTAKKFLLVLDDIWEDDLERNKSKWGDVLAPLASGKLGSKILVTTRMESVALMLAKLINKKNETLRIEGLKEDELLQLLNRYAFYNVEDPHVHERLSPIAAKIVKKLSGCPLAAKVMGGVLNDRLDERHWNGVLDNNNIGRHNDILSILKLSYLFLPNALQNCYAFCAVGPQDTVFNSKGLIQIWISLGFIQPSSIREESVEDNGQRYFDILVTKSLFEKFQNEEGTYYKLHDLLHEMVRSVSAQECYYFTGDGNMPSTIPETIRHLFVDIRNLEVLRNITRFKYLRSLFLVYHYGLDDDNFFGVLAKIFKTCRRIRVLDIFAPHTWFRMPGEIGQLIHLRCLSIYHERMENVIRSVINLYHLQFVFINDVFIGNYNDLLQRGVIEFEEASHLLS